MKVRETSMNLKRFEADEKLQKVNALKQMINDFDLMANELRLQVLAEEERTGIRDASHFAYSTFARSAAQRRDNLMESITDLKAKLETAITEREEILAEIEQADSAHQHTRLHKNNTHPHPAG